MFQSGFDASRKRLLFDTKRVYSLPQNIRLIKKFVLLYDPYTKKKKQKRKIEKDSERILLYSFLRYYIKTLI